MDFSGQQREALERVGKWYEAERATSKQQVFRLFGYAGTGKTTLARHFAEQCGGLVFFGAFTGKAALVLRSKGCPSARTIHKLIYLPKEKCRARLLQARAELEVLRAAVPVDADKVADKEAEMHKETDNLKRPCFTLNPDSELKDADLVVIDECSMVGERMGRDLLSYGVPVLVLGDPAQLPPVADAGFFTECEPDLLLTEIHRQAEGSPIIDLATRVREGGRLEPGDYGQGCRVVPKGELKIEDVMGFDQVLVGRNKTRKRLNARFREVLGRKSHLPEPGDRLVCLRNDGNAGMLNGAQWQTLSCTVMGDDRIMLEIADGDGSTVVEAHRHFFEDRERSIPPWEMREAQAFDYAYALTCHKAQGSAWPNVLVLDESAAFRGDARRWLYTALTRASESVTVVLT